MAEDYGNVRQAPHGRGYYSGDYPLYRKEPNETAVAEFGRQIASILNNITSSHFEPLQRIMEGVKAGYVDPDEALVQGTKGGDLFRKYYGVNAPPPRRPEMVNTSTYSDSTAEMEAGEPVPFNPNVPPVQFKAPTGRMTGGFTPATQAQLQEHIIRRKARGENVPDELVAMSGLLKTRAQQSLYNPQVQKDLEIIKQNPKLLREFTRLRQYAADDVTDADIIGSMRSTNPSLFPEAGPSGTGSYQSGANYRADVRADTEAKKIKSKEDIAAEKRETEIKIAQLRADLSSSNLKKRLASAKELKQLGITSAERRDKAKLESAADIADSKNYVSMVNHLSKYIGAENAHGVANEMIYGEGDWDNIPETIRDSAKAAFKKDQEFLDARIGNELTKPKDRAESLRLRTIDLERKGLAFEENMRRWAMQDQHRHAVDQLRMDLRALEVMSRDPNTRGQAAAAGRRLLKEWGVEVDEPRGIFTMLTHMASSVGAAVGFVSPEVETPKPFNTPRINQPDGERKLPTVPKPSNQAPAMSGSAQKFLDKYKVKPEKKSE